MHRATSSTEHAKKALKRNIRLRHRVASGTCIGQLDGVDSADLGIRTSMAGASGPHRAGDVTLCSPLARVLTWWPRWMVLSGLQ
jgi:hypothetical protein